MCYVLPGGRELREIVRIVDVGIMKLDLPRMARTIFDICCRTWINSRFWNPDTATVAFVDQLLGEKIVSVFPRVRCHVSRPLFNHFNGTEFFAFFFCFFFLVCYVCHLLDPREILHAFSKGYPLWSPCY